MSEERFIARQPIFDAAQHVVAYELLFRSDLDNYCKATDTTQASSTVISDSVLLFDLARLTDGRRAFVNIGRDGLLSEHARLLPNDIVTVEVLETVVPDEPVLAACRALKDAGYQLALDDFVDSPAMRGLIDLADVIKVDLQSSPEPLASLVKRLSRPGLKWLAEKVETRAEFEAAGEAGCEFFQGYFFARPVVMAGRDIPGFKIAYLELLRDINREPFALNLLEQVLKKDVSIAYKFLRYINSAAVGLRNQVTSIRETLLLLGQRNIRMLASVWALAGMGQDRPEALLVLSLTRARFCEGLAPLAGMEHRQAELFLVGMLSLVDAIMGRPMASIVAQLPLSDDARLVLVEQRGPLQPIMECTVAYERGDWDRAQALAVALGVPPAAIPDLYLAALPVDVGTLMGSA
jgi:c-di-GMP-related signal transduction protein